jgi:hypothetical protein
MRFRIERATKTRDTKKKVCVCVCVCVCVRERERKEAMIENERDGEYFCVFKLTFFYL